MSEVFFGPETPSFYPYADTFDVGGHSLAVITRMRKPVELGEEPSNEYLVGDILRRTCKLGGEVCAQAGCQAPNGYENIEKLCSDQNLLNVTRHLGIGAKDLVMVGVTADNVGFYDELKDIAERIILNSVGIQEIPGYNAFFARSSEEVALGARLADCGFAAIEMKDSNGEDVVGFTHLTRTNLQGKSELNFDIDGETLGSFEYFLHKAIEHYGGSMKDVKVRLISAIKGENSPYTFTDVEKMDQLFPGWFDQGMLVNTANPNWERGDEFNAADIWEPKYPEMLRWQIMRSGVFSENYTEVRMIDAGELEQGHASNHAGVWGKVAEGRDAYIIMPKSLVVSERLSK